MQTETNVIVKKTDITLLGVCAFQRLGMTFLEIENNLELILLRSALKIGGWIIKSVEDSDNEGFLIIETDLPWQDYQKISEESKIELFD